MTKRKALQVLIKHAARDSAGCGVGLRPKVTEQEKKEIKEAIKKLYKEAHDRDFDRSDEFNLGL